MLCHTVTTTRQRGAGASQVANAVASSLPVYGRLVQRATARVATSTVIESITAGSPVVIIARVAVQHFVRHQRLVRVIAVAHIGRNRLRSDI